MAEQFSPRPLLVGEANPHSTEPRHALFPLPPGCAGGRLCHQVMRLPVAEYVRRFDRANLCHPTWRSVAARKAARRVVDEARLAGGRDVVLLGSRVARAFGVDPTPFRVVESDGGVRFVVLPHPSGRCRVWNEPGSFARARRLLKKAGLL